LIKDLIKSYAVDKEIELDINVKDVNIGMKTLVPLGLIINELITNALNHAFVDRKKGKLTVHLMHKEDKQFEMFIGDDGIGLKENVISSGLGLELVQIFTEQLDGNMERLNLPGTRFRFTFKGIDKW